MLSFGLMVHGFDYHDETGKDMYFGNINNDAIVHCDAEYIYYSNITSDNGKLYQRALDFSKKEKLSDISEVRYINKHNSFLYYVSEGSIYKLNLANKQNEIIFSTQEDDLEIDEMIIVGEDLYFSMGYGNTITYKMNLDTLIPEKIIENTFGINIFNNCMYYTLNTGKGLYKLDLTKNKIIQIINSKTSYPIIKNDYLYYMDYNEQAFFSINLNKSNYEIEKIADMDKNIDRFNIISNCIVYVDYYLFKIDIDSKKVDKLTNIDSSKINIINDEIWFVAYENQNFNLSKIDLQGTTITVID